jgi:hypothetical protein
MQILLHNSRWFKDTDEAHNAYLRSKVVCFVLFCHAEISQTLTLHAALLVQGWRVQ